MASAAPHGEYGRCGGGSLQTVAPVVPDGCDHQHAVHARYAGRLPASLETLAGPQHGMVELPLHIAWSGLRAYDLDHPRLRMGLYRTVLAEGRHEDLVTLLNRDLLLAQWPVLRALVSRLIRRVWEEASDPAAYVADKIATAPARYRATATGHAPAATVLARTQALPDRVTPIDDTTCTVDLSGGSLPRITGLVATLGADCTLDADPEVLAHLGSKPAESVSHPPIADSLRALLPALASGREAGTYGPSPHNPIGSSDVDDDLELTYTA
ncbi:hypothetical protein [Streptomyces sp. NPDC048340]|uniref:hypothetical protein n=1 Tax=Streptomyces sp. NPDC048340 TaxID=3365537 RepID=UPI003710A69D